jgi:cytochrome c-type biogenesis protein CcmH
MIAWFIAPALVLALITTGLGILALRRGGREAGDAAPGARREMRIYADQLKEIDRDRARGLIADDEAERLRAETARRLLEADRRAVEAPGLSPAGMRGVGIALMLAVPLVAGWVYVMQGAPGAGDLPLALRHEEAAELRANRPSQAQMEADWAASPDFPPPREADPQYLALMEQLREAVAQRPEDQQGLRLLAVNEANLGNFSASAEAWLRLITVQGEAAAVQDLAALAEVMTLAAGGRISAETEMVLERLLALDPENGTARYYLGLMFAQTGRPDLTFRLWRGLLEDSEPNDPWVPAIRGTIEELAALSGVRYTLPPEGAVGQGPSAADMQAAAEMTPEERREMIGGMVEGLAARLAASGGPAQDWARLIGALGVLGQTDRARAIWAEARLAFADQPEDLAVIDAAAAAQGFGD